MKTLPNGLTVFNATPHSIRFWNEEWSEPVEVEPDTVVSAKAQEKTCTWVARTAELVEVCFVGTVEGSKIVRQAQVDGAHLVVGSIIAAQAYPGKVVAMTPAPGYERVPPQDRRMNPHKFVVFPTSKAQSWHLISPQDLLGVGINLP